MRIVKGENFVHDCQVMHKVIPMVILATNIKFKININQSVNLASVRSHSRHIQEKDALGRLFAIYTQTTEHCTNTAAVPTAGKLPNHPVSSTPR